MYLKVISDLHLEFGVPYFPTPDVRDPETVVILAGDINLGARVHDFIGSLRNNFNYRAIIFVPGNHEYYKGNIDDDYGPWTEAAVKLYQKSQLFGNLAADGDWGPKTEAHYLWVIRLQKTMNQWKGADIAVDGDYRRVTANRVEDLMRRNQGYTYHGYPDGVPGPVFCRMLGIPTHP